MFFFFACVFNPSLGLMISLISSYERRNVMQPQTTRGDGAYVEEGHLPIHHLSMRFKWEGLLLNIGGSGTIILTR